MPNYLSNIKPEFKATTIDGGTIRAYAYRKSLKGELSGKKLSKDQAVDML